jgi:hypothetical protein
MNGAPNSVRVYRSGSHLAWYVFSVAMVWGAHAPSRVVFGALAEHMLAPVAINSTRTGFTHFAGRRGAEYVFSAPASRFCSAPAARSGDGALDFRRAPVLKQGSGLARAPNPKRRGASLPAALQKWARPCYQSGHNSAVGWECANIYNCPPPARGAVRTPRPFGWRGAWSQ